VVIEDNPADVKLLKQAFNDVGAPYQLKVITDGEAALQFIADQVSGTDQLPCLMIVDLHLPRYEGTVILETIQQQPSLASVKLAVLTTVASPAQEAALEAFGVHLYRRKPLEWTEFCQLGQELMALCHERGQRAASTL